MPCSAALCFGVLGPLEVESDGERQSNSVFSVAHRPGLSLIGASSVVTVKPSSFASGARAPLNSGGDRLQTYLAPPPGRRTGAHPRPGGGLSPAGGTVGARCGALRETPTREGRASAPGVSLSSLPGRLEAALRLWRRPCPGDASARTRRRSPRRRALTKPLMEGRGGWNRGLSRAAADTGARRR